MSLGCEEKRIQPYKFRVIKTDKKGRRALFEYSKQLPILNMCGVSGCSECEKHYKDFLKELFNKGAREIELFRVKEPDVRLLFVRED